MSPELDRLVRDRELARAAAAKAAEEAFIVEMFASVAAERNTPHTRPGRPDWEVFTDEQWEIFDEMDELQASVQARFGRLCPKAFASMRNLAGRIF